MNTQQSLTPEKPFYMYFATGATHAPHHAPKDYIDKYKGKFSQGWDKLREETLGTTKETGRRPAEYRTRTQTGRSSKTGIISLPTRKASF